VEQRVARSGARDQIAEIARDEDVPLAHFHDTLEDPERPGRMRAEWTSDGDHPSENGYKLLGSLVAVLLAETFLQPRPRACG
jgi:lysophospholipase L1-like esterase